MTRAARVAVLVAALLTTGLAGCIGDAGGEDVDMNSIAEQGMAISVTPESGDASTNFTFDASETPEADDLTFHWDFGDGTNATGDVVHHVFKWTDNTYEVEVTASQGNQSISTTVPVEVGDGENEIPTVSVDSSKPWVAHGEQVELTADASDPDGDPVEVQWLVAKKVKQGGHDHGGDGGGHGHGGGGDSGPQSDPYGIAEPSGKNGTSATFSFDESGTYKLVGKAQDPKGGTAEDSVEIKVTRTVPKPTFTLIESDTLAAGTGAGQTGTSASELLYEVQQPSQNTFVDAARYDTRLIYPGEGTFSLDWSNSTAPADLDLFLQDSTGENVVELDGVNPTGTQVSTDVDLPKGSYTILVRANAGANIDYTVTLDLDLKIPGLTVGVDDGNDDGHDHEH